MSIAVLRLRMFDRRRDMARQKKVHVREMTRDERRGCVGTEIKILAMARRTVSEGPSPVPIENPLVGLMMTPPCCATGRQESDGHLVF